MYFSSNFNANLQVFISGKMLEKFRDMSFSKYSIKNSSSLLRNVNNETSILANNINLVIQIISETLVIIGMICLLLLIDFSVTIITILIFFSAGYFLLSLTKKISKAGKNRQEHDAKRINALNLIYGGFKN